jgi:hypothetical protein
MPAPTKDINVNEHYAKFATTSRLIACLTSEALVPVYFVPSSTSDSFVGLCLLLGPVKQENYIPTSVNLESILAVVPLRGLPILDNTITANWNGVVCPRIDLVDNIDMLPHIYSVSILAEAINPYDQVQNALKSVINEDKEFLLVDGYDAVSLWDRFAVEYKVSSKLIQQIGQELASSISFQSKIRFSFFVSYICTNALFLCRVYL